MRHCVIQTVLKRVTGLHFDTEFATVGIKYPLFGTPLKEDLVASVCIYTIQNIMYTRLLAQAIAYKL